MAASQEKVSIIIRTLNEERWIAACLRSVSRQNYQNYEVIVVDNNSTDNRQGAVSCWREIDGANNILLSANMAQPAYSSTPALSPTLTSRTSKNYNEFEPDNWHRPGTLNN